MLSEQIQFTAFNVHLQDNPLPNEFSAGQDVDKGVDGGVEVYNFGAFSCACLGEVCEGVVVITDGRRGVDGAVEQVVGD